MKTIAMVVLAAFMIGGLGVRTRADNAPAPTSAAASQSSDVMATVNGKPVYMNDINEILLYSYGLPVAQQLIANELVSQECEKLNVAVTDKDIQREHEKSLVQMWTDPKMTASERANAFEKFLTSSKVTRKQWDFTMRRNAQLAKLAGPKIKIADADIQQAFDDSFGRKVVVRHIMLGTLKEAQEVLDKLEKGADFLQMVKERSKNPSTVANGGLLMPITRQTQGFPPAIKDAALAMNKIGQISPIVQAGQVFHILKCDQIILPQNIRLEDVREKLRAQVYEFQLQKLQQEILMDLVNEARKKGAINFTNPTLHQLWKEASKQEAAAGP